MLVADRVSSDSSPAAVAEGPNLQLWVGPSEVLDETVDEMENKLSDQGSCSESQRAGTQQVSDPSSQILDSGTTANSAVGQGRTLLNHTIAECIRANDTKVYNPSGIHSP